MTGRAANPRPHTSPHRGGLHRNPSGLCESPPPGQSHFHTPARGPASIRALVRRAPFAETENREEKQAQTRPDGGIAPSRALRRFCQTPAKTRVFLGRKKARRTSGLGNLGGVEEDRTPDLRIANATLSQLSYHPTRMPNDTGKRHERKSWGAARPCSRKCPREEAMAGKVIELMSSPPSATRTVVLRAAHRSAGAFICPDPQRHAAQDHRNAQPLPHGEP